MTEEISEQRQSRLNKLARLEEMGYNPYPYRFRPDSYAKDLQDKYKDLANGEHTEDIVTVAGRAMAVRNEGETEVSLVNTPSEGRQRAVANALGIKIPQSDGVPAQIKVAPETEYKNIILAEVPVKLVSKTVLNRTACCVPLP